MVCFAVFFRNFVCFLPQKQTNSQAIKVNPVVYSLPVSVTYSTVLQSSVSEFGWNRGFAGQTYDAETGLVYNRGRYYSPPMGRFINRDPIGYDGQDVNLYRYVGNNPIKRLDPLGQKYIPPTVPPPLAEQVPYTTLPLEKQTACCAQSAKEDPAATGTMACCEGYAIPCFNETKVVSASTWVKTIVKVCTLKHELQHIRDLKPKCSPCDSGTIDFTKEDKETFRDYKTECNAYSIMVTCFDQYLNNNLLTLTESDKKEIKRIRNIAEEKAKDKCYIYNELIK